VSAGIPATSDGTVAITNVIDGDSRWQSFRRPRRSNNHACGAYPYHVQLIYVMDIACLCTPIFPVFTG
jgi:hypothetical protein